MGRPRAKRMERRSSSVMVYLTKEEYEKLKRVAANQNRPMSNQIRFFIMERLSRY
jgi:ribosomal protein S17